MTPLLPTIKQQKKPLKSLRQRLKIAKSTHRFIQSILDHLIVFLLLIFPYLNCENIDAEFLHNNKIYFKANMLS